MFRVDHASDRCCGVVSWTVQVQWSRGQAIRRHTRTLLDQLQPKRDWGKRTHCEKISVHVSLDDGREVNPMTSCACQ
jgi:hypothetical protein